MRERPAFGAADMDSVRSDTTVSVLGRFADFLYVRAPSGRAGWMIMGGPAGGRAGGQ